MKKIFGLMGIVGLLFAGCSSEDDILSAYHNDPDAVHITAEVGKASADGFTRSNPLGATEEDQKKFNKDDEISVTADGQEAVTYKFNGTEWVPQDSKFLKWESETMNFTAYYPATYTGGTPTQTLEYKTEADLVAADYMSYTGDVKNPGDNTLKLNMERQMARVVVEIVGFNNQYAANTTVNSVTINGTVKALKQGNMFYALMVPCEKQDNKEFLSLEVAEGVSKTTTETLTNIPKLEAGKSYTYQLTVGKNKVEVCGITVANWTTGEITGGKAELYAPYLTFTATGAKTFKMTTTGGYKISGLQYSVNNGKWEDVVADKPVAFGGTNGTLRLRGTNTNGTASNWADYSTITFNKDNVKVECTGDIRTLLDWRNYENVATDQALFCNLFEGCAALTSAPELPATELAETCYQNMFTNCTSLTSAPELLPAKNLKAYCYSYMFSGCKNLKSAPKMSAETLAQRCCEYMFYNCTSLKSAPELSATELAEYCYTGMFGDCFSLESAPKLPATELEVQCYLNMFFGCKNLKSAPELSATELEEYCYSGMFGNCTSLESAPALPAKKLAKNCYESMFYGCSNLSTVTMLAPSDQISENRFSGWLLNAGTKEGITRTLTLTDQDAYGALVNDLPDIWQKDATNTTVVYYTPKP